MVVVPEPQDEDVSSVVGRQGRVGAEDKLKVWVRCGGRCVFCNEYLLESDLTLRPVSLGEVAHNAAASDQGPRAEPTLSADERNSVDNLLLLCGRHHPDADKKAQTDLLTFEQLKARKEEHERRVFEATASVARKPTALLRMQGHVRGAPVDLSVETATEAVIRSRTRFPELAFSHDRRSIEIDLRQVAAERAADTGYYDAATARIDELIDQLLRPAVERQRVAHISLFALARLPLLVYLGSRIDDALEVDVFQRHRASESWVWPDPADDDPQFTSRREAPSEESKDRPNEAVLIINASGTIHPAELPENLAALPLYVIELDHGPPHPDSVRSRAVRDSFERAMRQTLATLEETDKGVTKLHVFAAAPVSVAVTLGRAVGWGIHPHLVVHDRTDDGTYVPGLEVTAP
jgi:hypothetical protein